MGSDIKACFKIVWNDYTRFFTIQTMLKSTHLPCLPRIGFEILFQII